MSKHTPGPWALTRTPTYWGVRCGVSQRLIGQVAHKGKNANSDADARLIAAAPILLSQLQLLVYAATKAPDKPETLPDTLRTCIAQARAAIARATGEAA